MIIKRVLVYCIGLFFMAMGVTFSVKSNLGVSPVNSIPYVISVITGINQGLWVSIIFSSYIGLQYFILRKDFKLHSLLQIVFASIFGYFVSFTNTIFYFQSPTPYILKLGLIGISMICMAVGIFLHLEAKIIPMPPEGVMLAIKQKTKFEFHNIKIGFDTVAVLTSCLISFIFLRKIIGAREGTLMAALFIGKIIGFLPVIFPKQIQALREWVK